MPDLTTPEGVREHMGKSKTPKEWVDRAAQVTAANGGKQPDFFYPEMIETGFRRRVLGLKSDIVWMNDED